MKGVLRRGPLEPSDGRPQTGAVPWAKMLLHGDFGAPRSGAQSRLARALSPMVRRPFGGGRRRAREGLCGGPPSSPPGPVPHSGAARVTTYAAKRRLNQDASMLFMRSAQGLQVCGAQRPENGLELGPRCSPSVYSAVFVRAGSESDDEIGGRWAPQTCSPQTERLNK